MVGGSRLVGESVEGKFEVRGGEELMEEGGGERGKGEGSGREDKGGRKGGRGMVCVEDGCVLCPSGISSSSLGLGQFLVNLALFNSFSRWHLLGVRGNFY